MSGVVKMGRYATALAGVTAALAGCGGSDATVTSPAASPSSTAASPSSTAASPSSTAASPSSTAASPSDAATSSSSAITLPTSSNGPTTCTVYESGYATQVIFESRSFDVRAECRAWTRNNAGEGYLWGYQPTSGIAEAAESTRVCYLTDPQRNLTASVIEATGFRSVSAVEAANGSSACVSLLAIGWTKQGGAPTTATKSTSKTGPAPRRRGRAQ
jgi:hypothetical protein